MNNNYNMEYVDVDGDATTVNSSTATLSLPAGADGHVGRPLLGRRHVRLGTGGSAAPNAANRGTVRFKVGAGAYQTVTAAPADVLTSTGKATRYRAFANVTALAAGRRQRHLHGGRRPDRPRRRPLRGLVAASVAYQDAAQDVHRVSVYDGLGTVDAHAHLLHRHHAVLHARDAARWPRKTGLLAFEGDAGIVGETRDVQRLALTDAINGPATS